MFSRFFLHRLKLQSTVIFSKIPNEFYRKEITGYMQRHSFKPGITGWAQINGRDEILLQDKLRFDQEYFERQSLFFDLKIILLTVAAVVRSRGVSH